MIIEPRPSGDTEHVIMELARHRATDFGQTTAGKVDVIHLAASELEDSRDLYAAASANGQLRRLMQKDPSLERRLQAYREKTFASAKDQAGMKLLDWVRNGQKGVDARRFAHAVNERVAEYGSKFAAPETEPSSELTMKAKLMTAIKQRGDDKVALANRYRKETVQCAKLAGGMASVEVLTQLSRLLALLPAKGNTAFLHAAGATDDFFVRRYIGAFSGGGCGLFTLGTLVSARNWRNAAVAARTCHGAHEILSTQTPTEV